MWTESRGRLPTYLLVGGSGPNVVHACNFFFFFLSEYKICLPGGRRIPVHVFRRPRIFGIWLTFSEDQGFFRALAHVFRGSKVLDHGSCFQRPRIFWILAHVFRGPRVFWALAHVFSGPKFPDPGSCFQRPRILGLGSGFQRTKGFGALAHVFRGPKVLDPGSCFQRPRIFGSWLMLSEDQGF